MKKSLVIPIIFISVLFSFLDMKVYGQEEKDSIDKVKTHGVYIELLGSSLFNFYSVGYEYSLKKTKNTLGYGAGFSITPGFRSSSIYHGWYFFYEYGRKMGLNLSLGINGVVYPAMLNNKLDGLPPPDKPSFLHIYPSFSPGFFILSKNRKFKLTLAATSFYVFTYKETFAGNIWNRDFFIWGGIKLLYNFKMKNK